LKPLKVLTTERQGVRKTNSRFHPIGGSSGKKAEVLFDGVEVEGSRVIFLKIQLLPLERNHRETNGGGAYEVESGCRSKLSDGSGSLVGSDFIIIYRSLNVDWLGMVRQEVPWTVAVTGWD